MSAIAKPIAQSVAHPSLLQATPCGETEAPPPPRALADADVSRTDDVQRLESRSGASLELAREGASERLRVRDGSGTLIFEHDPESGRSTLCVAGDLSLQTGGHLDLVAAKGVRVMSPGPVAIESATHLSAGVTGAHSSGPRPAGPRSSGARFAGMRALPGGLMITGRRLEAVAERANLTFERLQARGKVWDATAERVKLTAVRLETVAERVLRRAQNVYDHVDELKQERLGRLRTLVCDAIDFRGKTATFITTGETRIDGERIHLG